MSSSPHVARYALIGIICTLLIGFVGLGAYTFGEMHGVHRYRMQHDESPNTITPTNTSEHGEQEAPSTTSHEQEQIDLSEDLLSVEYIAPEAQKAAKPDLLNTIRESESLRQLFFLDSYIDTTGRKAVDIFDRHAASSSVEIGKVKGGTYDGWGVERHLIEVTNSGIGFQHRILAHVLRHPTSGKLVLIPNQKMVPHTNTDVFFDWTETQASLKQDAPSDLAKHLMNRFDIAPFLRLEGLVSVSTETETRTPVVQAIQAVPYPAFGKLAQYTLKDFKETWTRGNAKDPYFQKVGTLADGTELRNLVIPSKTTENSALSSFESTLLNTVRPDGLFVWYEAKAPFWLYEGPAQQNLTVTRTATTHAVAPFKAPFIKGLLGGCGFNSPTLVVSNADLEAWGGVAPFGTIGSTKIYALKTPERHPEAQKEGTQPLAKEIGSFIYWQDGLGFWHELRRADLVPEAECGKPVIYLYPEKETDLTVEVAPEGGFSVTEPLYHDGWFVKARPDGTVVNREDGRVYPYLFWEGLGGAYGAPTSYWVVAKDEVATFLPETLAKFGLQGREIDEFVEFWLPRMQSAPFYKVGFHGTETMNRLAPLTISEAPDSVLRILMDYEELQAPIEARPPTRIPHFERHGFTVVEWGGVLHR